MALPQEVIDQMEQLITEKFNELVAARKLDVTAEATNLTAFETQMMQKYDGNEPITQGFFRTFLAWLNKYYSYITELSTAAVTGAIRYIKQVDYASAPDCGKVIAPVGFLVLTGEGVRPTIPTPADATPDDAAFDLSTHIIEGSWALNVTDNLWYYRKANTIYELKDALSLEVADITDFTTVLNTALSGYVQVVAGKGLTKNELTDILKTGYDGAVTHAALTAIHKEYDNSTIKLVGDKLAVDATAVKNLFSGTAPISITNGVGALAINTDQFEIVAGKLQIKAGVLGGGDPVLLSYNPTTHILTIGSTGNTTVDLSTLVGGAVDLSNYVKKTGETSQTIAGALKCTGEIEPFAS